MDPAPTPRPVLCQRCAYRWEYKGNNPYVATCPHCFTKVTLKRSEERLRRLDRLAPRDGAACA